jgi:hypothetical protein
MKCTRVSRVAWRCTISIVPSSEPLSITRIAPTPSVPRRRSRQSSMVSALR